MSDDKPAAIVAIDDVGVCKVIDLAGVRIAQGFPNPKVKMCEHKTMVYSVRERLVWCADCEQLIDAFAALMTVIRHFDDMLSDARIKQRNANEAYRTTARLRATKELDRLWSGNVMAAQCPHCKGGLLPEDFANGASAAWARDLEIADRKRRQKTAPESEDSKGPHVT